MAFPEVLRRLREETKRSVAELAAAVNLSVSALYKFEEGSRTPDERQAAFLKKALCGTEAKKQEFEASLDHLRASRQPASPLSVQIDSNKAVLRVLPVRYPPFSGSQSCFVDHFVQRMLELAVIRYLVPEHFQAELDSRELDIKGRIEAVCRGDADLLINLASLQRARRLTFLHTPIRVSVNGVMLRRNLPVLPDARLFLTNRGCHLRFHVIAIENEVGWVHVARTLKIPVTQISTISSFDPAALADWLRVHGHGESPCMLITDELTTLAVLRELHGEGMLVFQPSTDDSVSQSEKRRSLPAHALAIAVRRGNLELYGYLVEALRTFLTFEMETIAASYEDLYWRLVQHVQECLSFDESIHLGGVKRLCLDKLPSALRTTLLAQNARAYARRSLQLSRRAIEATANDPDPWMRMLRRARERVQITDAKNRGMIKAIVIMVLKTIVGLDPVVTNRKLTLTHFRQALTVQWSELKYTLERELDVDVPLNDPLLRQELAEAGSIEGFVSRLQQRLEAPAERASVTVIVDRTAISNSQFRELTALYSAEAPPSRGRAKPATVTFVALNLGEVIGFIEAVVYLKAAREPDAASIEITRVFVVEHMRGNGISRLLVRRVVEYADTAEVAHSKGRIASVWLNTGPVPSGVRKIFIDYGFAEAAQRVLIYRLDRVA